jgi:hypothetical protein
VMQQLANAFTRNGRLKALIDFGSPEQPLGLGADLPAAPSRSITDRRSRAIQYPAAGLLHQSLRGTG